MRELQQRLSATEARQSTMISFIGRVAANPSALQQLAAAAAAARAGPAPGQGAALVPVAGSHSGYPWLVPMAGPAGIMEQAGTYGLYGAGVPSSGPGATVLGVDAAAAAPGADAAAAAEPARGGVRKKRRASAREAESGAGAGGQLITYVPQPTPAPASGAAGSPLAAVAAAAVPWPVANGAGTPPGLSPRAAGAAAGIGGLQLDAGATGLLEQLQAQQLDLHREAAARAETQQQHQQHHHHQQQEQQRHAAEAGLGGGGGPPPAAAAAAADEERAAAQLMRDLRLQHDPEGEGEAGYSPRAAGEFAVPLPAAGAPGGGGGGGSKLGALGLQLQQPDLGEDDLRGLASLDQLGSLPFASMPSNDLGLADDLAADKLWQSLVAGAPAVGGGAALE
jgi:hypothetical protein